MNAKDAQKFFEEMFRCIWKSEDLARFDEFYAKDFRESIHVADERNQPLELSLNYEELKKAAQKQKNEVKNTTFEIKKIIVGEDHHLSVHFYSSSICKKTGEIRHRWVCGIWHLNKDRKIDQVWAVVTPYYPS